MTFLSNLRQALRRRRAARQLRGLPPHLLRDIGIEPDQVEDVVTDMLHAQEAPRPYAKPAPDLIQYKASLFSRADWPYSRRHAA